MCVKYYCIIICYRSWAEATVDSTGNIQYINEETGTIMLPSDLAMTTGMLYYNYLMLCFFKGKSLRGKFYVYILIWSTGH